MTRFARAKGSKASNERAPEDGTPWEVMQEQLAQSKKEAEENKKRQEADRKRQENYEKFLKEQKVAKRKSTWCDFPEDSKKSKTETLVQGGTLKPKKNKKKNKSDFSFSNEIITETGKQQLVEVITDTVTNDASPKKQDKRKKSKNKVKLTTNDNELNVCKEQLDEVTTETIPIDTSEKQKKKSKNMVKLTTNNDELNVSKEQLDEVITETTSNDTSQKQKKKKKEAKNKLNYATNDNTKDKEQESKKHKKKEKNENSKAVRRKPITDHSFCLIINGKEVELQRFDGFPVMKKDAERLQQLKQNMINKGIPKSEVLRTIKLERRRAEKALARIKKDVCYNCRKGGHNLSDCPELKSKIPGVESADGICFKCGSTEHRSIECKVQKDQGFRFATCFICKEQGHIARQCPDNPKGLYPNGGGCKLCGDVTHLRKDCPTSQDKREESNIRLDTYDNVDNLEGMGEEKVQAKTTEDKIKMPKKIKF